MRGFYRFTPNRKAAIVRALEEGRMTRGEALEKYALCDEELSAWIDRYQTGGVNNLRVTRRPYTKTSRKACR